MNVDRVLLVAQIVGVSVLVWVGVGASKETLITVGEMAPEFSVVVADDGRSLSRDNFGGKLLMVNFWATWCPPCVYEMPGLSKLSSRLRSRGLTVLAVSFDEEEEKYRNFLQRLQPPFLTTRSGGRELAAAFGTFRIPETYIIDGTGRVVRKYADYRDWTNPEILRDLESLLQ